MFCNLYSTPTPLHLGGLPRRRRDRPPRRWWHEGGRTCASHVRIFGAVVVARRRYCRLLSTCRAKPSDDSDLYCPLYRSRTRTYNRGLRRPEHWLVQGNLSPPLTDVRHLYPLTCVSTAFQGGILFDNHDKQFFMEAVDATLCLRML